MPGSGADADLVIAGVGVAAGHGYGMAALESALFEQPPDFALLQRPGREPFADQPAYPGLELPDPPALLSARTARTAGFAARVAIAVLHEAWTDAALDRVTPERIGLVVGGTNLFAREQTIAQRGYADRMAYWPPRHGHVFLDTDLCGLCTAHFPIRGFAHTVGAASASGAAALVAAAEAVQAGRVDACIALGALQDVSALDLAGFRALGVMGSVSRPFDRDHDGFVFAEGCAALVVRRRRDAGTRLWAALAGWAEITDGTRGPEPSSVGQRRAIEGALAMAGEEASGIDYVNAHATGTPQGDQTELASFAGAGLRHARINATKSLLGHGLSAAGAVEVAATLLQMRRGRLHPTRHLVHPLDAGFNWIMDRPVDHWPRAALKTSFGFGGTNVALVLRPGDSA